jgi:hypothetical protein
VYGEEKNILFWADKSIEQPRQNKYLALARQAQWINQGRTPFICTLWVPIHLSFNSQQGPPLSIVSLEWAEDWVSCFSVHPSFKPEIFPHLVGNLAGENIAATGKFQKLSYQNFASCRG